MEIDRVGPLESLLEQASSSTGGLSDFGRPTFRAALERFIEGIDGSKLSEAGLARLRRACVGHLQNRLRVTAAVTRHPEVRKQSIEKPLFILSLPRSGSTLLHNLIAMEERCRTFETWELLTPIVDPAVREPRITREQIAAAEKQVVFNALTGGIRLHPTSILEPNECQFILRNSFQNLLWHLSYPCGRYLEWLFEQDLTEAFDFHRRQIEVMLWQRPCPENGFIAFKDPINSMVFLPAVLEAYPDARFVYIDRELSDVVGSSAYLARLLRAHSLTGEADLHAVGRETLSLMLRSLTTFKKHVTELDLLRQGRLQFVDYRDLMRSPRESVRSIFKSFDYPSSANLDAKIELWLKENPANKHGKYSYDIEDYGLSREMIKDTFSGLNFLATH